MAKAAFRIQTTKSGTTFSFKEMVDTPTSITGQAPLKSRGHSELYTGPTQAGSCRKGIESVKQNSIDPRAYFRETSSNQRFYFNLRAINNEIIFSSPLRKKQEEMEGDIKFFIENAASAIVLWGKQSSSNS